jgi:hypothetical protein
MEDAMNVHRLLCVVVAIVTGTGLVHAVEDQREAALQKVELPNASFNLIIAAKVGGTFEGFRNQPDPNVIYLADAELVYSYTGRLNELAELGALMPPACRFYVERGDFSPRTPVVVYLIPKGDIPLEAARK